MFPRLDDLTVGTGVGAQPLEEVEDQGVDTVGHRCRRGRSRLTLW